MNALPHLKQKWGRLIIFLSLMSLLELGSIFAQTVITDHSFNQFILFVVFLFIKAIVFLGIYRICFENRSIISALEIDLNVVAVMEAYLWIHFLSSFVLIVIPPIFLVRMVLLIFIQIFTLFLPILSMKGYRGIYGMKQSIEIFKVDFKKLFILFIFVVMHIVTIYLFQFVYIKLINILVILKVNGFAVLTDTYFLSQLFTQVIVPGILPFILVVLTKVFVVVLTTKYTEYL